MVTILNGCHPESLISSCHREHNSTPLRSASPFGNLWRQASRNGFSFSSPILLIEIELRCQERSSKPCSSLQEEPLLTLRLMLTTRGEKKKRKEKKYSPWSMLYELPEAQNCLYALWVWASSEFLDNPNHRQLGCIGTCPSLSLWSDFQ